MLDPNNIPKLENIQDVQGGVEATGDLTVKEGLFAEKNASVGGDLDVAGDTTVGKLTLTDVLYVPCPDVEDSPAIEFVRGTGADSNVDWRIMSDKYGRISFKWRTTGDWSSNTMNISNGRIETAQIYPINDNNSSLGTPLRRWTDIHMTGSIHIGDTELTEEKLIALLALLEN